MTAGSPAAAQLARPLAPAPGSAAPQAVPIVTDPCLYHQECAAPTFSTGNLLANASFETVINCRCPQPRNMANPTTTKVCAWTDANNTRSDIYHTCATGSPDAAVYYYGAPNNLYGTQAARTGSGYLGLLAYGFYGTTGTPPTERRSYATTNLAAPLEAGRAYYAEYYVSLAETAQRRVASLGFGVSVGYPGRTVDGLLVPNPNYYGNIYNPVNDAGAVLTDRAGWQPVRGTFVAQGGEDAFTVGCFATSASPSAAAGATASQYATPAALAYYYLDDALLMAVPRAGATFAVNACPASFALPVDGLALPASSGATYRWTADNDPAFVATTLTPTVTPAATTTYTLTLTLPGQAPLVSSVTAYVNCCYDSQTPGIRVVQGTVSNPAVFAASGRFYVPGNLLLSGGTYTVPETCTIYVAAGASVSVGNGATLDLAGGTITAACRQMWDGIVVGNGGNFSSRAGASTGRRSEISYALNALVYQPGSSTPLVVDKTNFLHNYDGLSLRDNGRSGTVSNCLFDADPVAMLSPYAYVSASSFSHTQRHVQVTNTANAAAPPAPLLLTGNTFKRAMFGVWVGAGATAPALRSNQFRGIFVAGVYANSPASGAAEMSGNSCRFPTDAVNSANPPQLNSAYALAPGSNRQEAYGLLAKGPNVYLVGSNTFQGPGPIVVLDAVPTYRHVGVSASDAIQAGGNSAYPQRNKFTNVYECLRLQLKGGAGSVAENEFTDCVYGIHLLGPGVGGVYNTFRLQCNSFVWTAAAQLFGNNSPRGIFIDANYPVQLTGSFTAGPGNLAGLLKNYFINVGSSTVTHVWNHPSNPAFNYPTFDALYYGNVAYNMLIGSNINITRGAQGVAITSTNDCAFDNYPGAGILARNATGNLGYSSVSALVGLAPNPVADELTVHYHLAEKDAGEGQLIIRSLLSGQVVAEIALMPRTTSALVPVHELATGLYTCTLVVNGQPVSTSRLAVSR